MASSDDDRFRTWHGAPGAKAGSNPDRFVSRVVKEVSKAGFSSSLRASRSSGSFGRGRAAAALRGSKLGPRARRVVLKSRFVVLARAGQKSVTTHLRYIERDGTTRDGGKGRAYGPDSDAVNLKGFEERGQGDRHQFRFILSAEDAQQLEDLKRFTREFMNQVEKDLQTRLDWVAVDHWDTDNPHTHIVLRGRGADGNDLVIAPDYMAHGMRMRASDIATQWLGPRTELEIQESLRKEVAQERFTGLDRVLLGCAVAEIVDFDAEAGRRRDALHLRGRLQRLETMRLAEKTERNRWRLSSHMRETLVAMGERDDIVLAANRALSGASRDIAFETPGQTPIIGRVAGKGMADELSDRAYLVVDGVDGRAHFVRLPPGADLSEFPLGSVVHAGVGASRTRVLCYLSIADQVTCEGPTWLDRQLIGKSIFPCQGFGVEARTAIEARKNVLVSRGLVERRDGKLIAPDLIGALRTRELEIAAGKICAESGKPHVPQAAHGQRAKTTVRELRLASGRFAVMESTIGFTLVPWSKDLKSQLERELVRRQLPSM